MTAPLTPEELLRLAVRDLHRWDLSQGWGKFNTILGRIDDHLATLDAARAAAPEGEPEWPALANDIRAVDGNHALGAGALAEALTSRGWTRLRSPAEGLLPDGEPPVGHPMYEAWWQGYEAALALRSPAEGLDALRLARAWHRAHGHGEDTDFGATDLEMARILAAEYDRAFLPASEPTQREEEAYDYRDAVYHGEFAGEDPTR